MAELYERALSALEQGHGAEASSLLIRALKQPGLGRDDQIQIRCALAEAWLLQDDLRQATEALGRPPDARERLDPARLSDLWRMHGRLAAARGEPSRGIAFLTKALKQAERAHDSRAIGLAHYELGLCYRQVGDTRHRPRAPHAAASALHAAGDRRHLAMVHSLSGVTLAQEGRLDEALAALRHAERLALPSQAGDVLATVCGNQANVALMQHRHDQALALAERSVELQEESGTPHGLGVALALARADLRAGRQSEPRRGGAQPRARRPQPAAVHARDDRRRLRHARADSPDSRRARGGRPRADRTGQGGLRRVRDPDGRWYQWSLRVLEARLALRRGQARAALSMGNDIARSMEGVPAVYASSGRADRDRSAARVRAPAARPGTAGERRAAHPTGQR